MSLTPEELEAIMERKNKMRREAYDRRNAQENKDEVSAKAVELFMALPEYQNAHTVMWYIDCRSELRTKPELLAEVAKGEKKIIVPYCTEDENATTSLACGGWKVSKKWSSESGIYLSHLKTCGAIQRRKLSQKTLI